MVRTVLIFVTGVGQAGCMGEQMTNRDNRLAAIREPGTKLRDPFTYWVIQSELSLLYQGQSRRRHNRFGQRGIAKNRVRLSQSSRFPIGESGRSLVNDRISVGDRDHSPDDAIKRKGDINDLV